MRTAALLLLISALALAHLGEEESGPEQHSALEIILDNPALIITAFVVYGLVALVFHAIFPLKKRDRRRFIIIALGLSLIFLVLLVLSLTKEPTAPKPYHAHADFKVYLDGEPFNFSQAEYMSQENGTLSQKVHLHDMDGEVIHHHARNVTMADFFSSLGFTFNSACLVTDAGVSYCENGNRSLRMFVMHYGEVWAESRAMEGYVFQDLDRILITYGDPSIPIPDQLMSVTDRACIQSERCPERGEPSDESICAGEVCLV